MNDVVIRVEGLSKEYRLGHAVQRYATFRESFAQMGSAPWRWMKRWRSGRPVRESFYALKDLSFNVHRGQVVGVIGRNGAGKSTLLKVLSRITDPTAGFIEIHGRMGSLLEVGTGFHPELTGGENIYLNGAILGMKKTDIDRRFDAIVAFAEVEKFIDTQVKHYSSGMYLRLAFSVAAHLEPDILLVDEVLAVGDAAFQAKCLGKMSEVSREGRTVLFVSHNMAAVQELCTRGLLLRHGQVAFDGKPSECIARYTGDLKDQSGQLVEGHSPLVLGNVRVTNLEGSEDITAGQPFRVQLTLRGKNIANPHLFFLIEDHSGQQLVHQRVTSRDIGVATIDGTCSLELTVPGLWLTPGVYSIYFKFLLPALGLKNRVISDRVMIEFMSEDRHKGTFAGGSDSVTVLTPKVQWQLISKEGSGTRSVARAV